MTFVELNYKLGQKVITKFQEFKNKFIYMIHDYRRYNGKFEGIFKENDNENTVYQNM
jgi:hypothetical protein